VSKVKLQHFIAKCLVHTVFQKIINAIHLHANLFSMYLEKKITKWSVSKVPIVFFRFKLSIYLPIMSNKVNDTVRNKNLSEL